MLEVDETFKTIWLSRSSDVRVKVRRWPQSPIGTMFTACVLSVEFFHYAFVSSVISLDSFQCNVFYVAKCKLCLCRRHDIRLSVCLYVTGGLCCNKKWNWHIARWIGVLAIPDAEADLDRSILWTRIILKKTTEVPGKLCTSLRHNFCLLMQRQAPPRLFCLHPPSCLFC